MPPPFTVRSGAFPESNLGSWDSTGSISIPGNLTVAGITTLANFALAALALSGNLTVGGTLGVTGTSTLAAVNSGAHAVTGVLSSSGATSLATGGGATTVGGTLGVTGATNVAALNVSGTLAATGIGGVLIARCTADTTKNANVTLGDITGMSAALAANATYLIEAWIFYQSNPTADMKLAVTLPSGATGIWGSWGVPFFTAPVVGSERVNYIDTGTLDIVNALTVGGDDEFTGSVWISCRPTGFVTTTSAGTLQFQFAQATSDASNSIIKSGSFCRLTRVA